MMSGSPIFPTPSPFTSPHKVVVVVLVVLDVVVVVGGCVVGLLDEVVVDEVVEEVAVVVGALVMVVVLVVLDVVEGMVTTGWKVASTMNQVVAVPKVRLPSCGPSALDRMSSRSEAALPFRTSRPYGTIWLLPGIA